MDEFMSVQTKSNEINKAQLKEHLKNVVPEDVYEKWIEYFEFEEIGDEEIVIGYYGKASLRKFEKKYKKMVWLEICSYIGCVKKLNISKRKEQPVAEVKEDEGVLYFEAKPGTYKISPAQGKTPDSISFYHNGGIFPMSKLHHGIDIFICKIDTACKSNFAVNHNYFSVIAIVRCGG